MALRSDRSRRRGCRRCREGREVTQEPPSWSPPRARSHGAPCTDLQCKPVAHDRPVRRRPGATRASRSRPRWIAVSDSGAAGQDSRWRTRSARCAEADARGPDRAACMPWRCCLRGAPDHDHQPGGARGRKDALRRGGFALHESRPVPLTHAPTFEAEASDMRRLKREPSSVAPTTLVNPVETGTRLGTAGGARPTCGPGPRAGSPSVVQAHDRREAASSSTVAAAPKAATTTAGCFSALR